MATPRFQGPAVSNLDFAKQTRNNPIGTTPYRPGLAAYRPTSPATPTNRSRLDPERIAGRMARGNARPGEVAAAQFLMSAQAQQAQMPILQARADQASLESDVLARYRDKILPGTGGGATQPPAAATPVRATANSMFPEAEEMIDPVTGMLRPTPMSPIMEGGPMEESEDAYLLGEEGPEMAIKRDDGSLFVLPADVTKKIMAGMSMDDTPENQDAMAAAMERMGMEVAPKMCGGKMKPRMAGGEMNPFNKGTKLKSYMAGGTMMAKETGRMSRSQRRKNTLFDAMQKLV